MPAAAEKSQPKSPTVTALSVAALGVVFGDIGTSPLYTLKTVLAITGDKPEIAATLGSLSLILWTLIIVTTVKYVSFAMRVDNDGEGGILALMSLLGVKIKPRPAVVALGLLGAALIYGDGAITPAISVLSALEGLDIVDPSFARYVLPVSVTILVVLFSIQPRGTARIGRIFGPIMTLWFAVIGLLGIWGIAQHPTVLIAINPYYGLHYLATGGSKSFLVLGGVFLCVTGAEALYADMGHFGTRPIRIAWSGLVFPSLVLNYAGQAALVLNGVPTTDNIFYRLCPQAMLVPMVLLATVATIIASQSIITGAFSMTRQAIQLGWMPRLQITQTSAEGYGQIYVGVVNWILMVATIGLVLGFKKSDNLAAAYGIAVSLTMLATSVLLYIAMRELWSWGRFKAGSIAGVFMLVDTSFVCSNLTKVTEGGYIPLIFAGLIYATMLIWHTGMRLVTTQLETRPINEFMQTITDENIPRVPGTAVFLTRTERDAPPVMLWHVKHNRALHERLFVLKVETVSKPWIRKGSRLSIELIAPNFWRAIAQYGFMERPDIPALLRQAKTKGCTLDLDDVTYYVGHETVIAKDDHKGMPYWAEICFAFMERNSVHVSDYFQLPQESLVEIGRQIVI
jgi:KUP system potassium uptake protein